MTLRISIKTEQPKKIDVQVENDADRKKQSSTAANDCFLQNKKAYNDTTATAKLILSFSYFSKYLRQLFPTRCVFSRIVGTSKKPLKVAVTAIFFSVFYIETTWSYKKLSPCKIQYFPPSFLVRTFLLNGQCMQISAESPENLQKLSI